MEKKNENYISLGNGEEGQKRAKTASILVQLFHPMDGKKEISMNDVDKAYQNVLDDLSEVLENMTDKEWKVLQILTNIGKKLKRTKELDFKEVIALLGELKDMNVINLDRMPNIQDIQDIQNMEVK